MATETKVTHTAGPWHISEVGPLDCLKPTRDNCVEIESADSMRWVAQVLHLGEHGEANARLIAAAPELLEALKALTDPEGHIPHGSSGECTGECKDARAAIAKAEGK